MAMHFSLLEMNSSQTYKNENKNVRLSNLDNVLFSVVCFNVCVICFRYPIQMGNET